MSSGASVRPIWSWPSGPARFSLPRLSGAASHPSRSAAIPLVKGGHLWRAGFNAFEVKKEADAVAFAHAVARYSVFYQPTGDGRLAAGRARAGGMRSVPAAPDAVNKGDTVY